ncbi:MAG: isoprenylcysteine carboxylmethyltransferase family protein [Gemmatimonadota bacterium]
MMWLRHAVAIAVLPFTVALIIPVFLARRNGVALDVGDSVAQLLAQTGGLVALVVGVLLFISSLRRFAGEGRGTLAPWDPPRELVVRGPYRFVRNPMISGVLLVLLGESLVLLSRAHLMWAVAFFVINAVYIPLLEEPQLATRFGRSYDEYRRHVPRLIPRLTPWDSSRP